ncbi:MAG: peptidase C39 family protein [archaeon]
MKPYKQTTEYTTAASSILTILSHFNKLKPTEENELKIWRASVTLPTRASSIYSLALIAKELNPIIIVEIKEYDFPDYRFYRYSKEDIEIATKSSDIHLQQAINHNIEIKEEEITIKQIKQLLKENILLLRLNTKPIRNSNRNNSNFLVVYDFNNNYKIIDPLQGDLEVTEQIFNEAFKTLATKKHRAHKMIVFKKTL